MTQHAAAARETAQARLATHPYADIDLTDAALARRLQDEAQLAAPETGQLAQLMLLDEAQLYQSLYDTALGQVKQRAGALSLMTLMDLQAADMLQETQVESGPAADDDLVAATLEAAYRRVGSPAVELDRKAAPQDWWLVGVPDETNPGFAFENATLVGSGRRDQLQFVHVQVGIAPQDLTAFAAARQPFEQASAMRNYYVLEELATDDHVRQALALGLAGGVIAIRGGVFALAEDDHPLGSTVEEALDQFSQHPDLIEVVQDRFNALGLPTAIERMEAYLARGRSVQDELWWEFASYVRDRLELARHQLTFASG